MCYSDVLLGRSLHALEDSLLGVFGALFSLGLDFRHALLWVHLLQLSLYLSLGLFFFLLVVGKVATD